MGGRDKKLGFYCECGGKSLRGVSRGRVVVWIDGVSRSSPLATSRKMGVWREGGRDPFGGYCTLRDER